MTGIEPPNGMIPPPCGISSNPSNQTCLASSFKPAALRISDNLHAAPLRIADGSRPPLHAAHGFRSSLYSARRLPAQVIVAVTECFLNRFPSSASEKLKGFSTSPSTLSR